MKKLIIIGAGGHAKVVLNEVLRLNEFEVVGLLDDNKELVSKEIWGYKVLGPLELTKKIKDAFFVVAIGDNKTREKIVNDLQIPNERYANIISPFAVLGKNVKLGFGNMIISGAVINCESVLGNHNIVNTSVSIDHESKIDSFVHLAPGSHLGGNVNIGKGTLIGIGSTILPSINIGSYCIIGGGAVATKNIEDFSLAVGVPARIVKRLK